MFFPQRITGIKPTDRVLDIGPGADPHPRSNVLLEMAFADEAEYANQFGHGRKLETDKQLVLYDGTTFPFADGEFDYVICTHVVEHVPNLEHFLSEVFRVGKRGYFEYPLAYYDLIYNINAHVNFVKRGDGTLRYMKKSASHLAEFKPLQALLLETMEKGHTKLIDDLPDLFMEGFQWEAPFACQQVHSLAEVCHTDYRIPERKTVPLDSHGAKQLVQALLKVAGRRMGLG